MHLEFIKQTVLEVFYFIPATRDAVCFIILSAFETNQLTLMTNTMNYFFASIAVGITFILFKIYNENVKFKSNCNYFEHDLH